jgi:hypothetical protein
VSPAKQGEVSIDFGRRTRSLRVAVAFVIVILFFAVVFLFVLFLVWFFSKDDIRSYRAIRGV